MIELSPHLRSQFPGPDAFDRIMDSQGKTHREVKHRRTLEVEIGGRRYFLKIHRGCGWGEILKDLFQGRLPVTGARPEWEALATLHALGVPTLTVAGKGWRGLNPSARESFLITEALDGMISLETLVQNWSSLPLADRRRLKQALTREIAAVAATLHNAGVNHRDFYLCHFLVRDRSWPEWRPSGELKVHLIDLHRAQMRCRTPRRWRAKDLAGLLFSALDADLTDRDLFRFLRFYLGANWRVELRAHSGFWRGICRKAVRLYTGFHNRLPKGPRAVIQPASP
jgi:heptose I phosphotransferase